MAEGCYHGYDRLRGAIVGSIEWISAKRRSEVTEHIVASDVNDRKSWVHGGDEFW